jgi:hypothetical protein
MNSPLPHLHRDWAHPCHICTRTGLTPATFALGLNSPLPHLRRDWAHPCHICTGTGLTPTGRTAHCGAHGLRLWSAVDGRWACASGPAAQWLRCDFGRRSWQGEPVVVNLRAGSVLFFDYRPAAAPHRTHIACTHARTHARTPASHRTHARTAPSAPSIRGSSLGRRRRQPEPESGVVCAACVGDAARCTAHTASELIARRSSALAPRPEPQCRGRARTHAAAVQAASPRPQPQRHQATACAVRSPSGLRAPFSALRAPPPWVARRSSVRRRIADGHSVPDARRDCRRLGPAPDRMQCTSLHMRARTREGGRAGGRAGDTHTHIHMHTHTHTRAHTHALMLRYVGVCSVF